MTDLSTVPTVPAIDPRIAIATRDYVDARLDAMDRAIVLQFRASEIAVAKSDEAITFRLNSLNEFRQTLSDQNKNYATRIEVNALLSAYDTEIKALARQVYLLVGVIVVVQMLFQYLVR